VVVVAPIPQLYWLRKTFCLQIHNSHPAAVTFVPTETKVLV
jgi:hypothetical protein